MIVIKGFLIANWVSAAANLAFYAWGEHAPASLAVGIFNCAIALALEICVAHERR